MTFDDLTSAGSDVKAVKEGGEACERYFYADQFVFHQESSAIFTFSL